MSASARRHTHTPKQEGKAACHRSTEHQSFAAKYCGIGERKRDGNIFPRDVAYVTHSFIHKRLNGPHEETDFGAASTQHIFREEKASAATSSRSNRHRNELSKKQIYFTRSSSPPPTRPSLRSHIGTHTHTPGIASQQQQIKSKKITLEKESSGSGSGKKTRKPQNDERRSLKRKTETNNHRSSTKCVRVFFFGRRLAGVAASSSFGGRLFGVPRRPLPQTSKRLLLSTSTCCYTSPDSAPRKQQQQICNRKSCKSEIAERRTTHIPIRTRRRYVIFPATHTSAVCQCL